jgi:alkaline phosphatase D
MPATRRTFLQTVSSLAASPLLAKAQSPAIVPTDSARPVITYGVMSGDVAQGSGVIWSRADRPARMIVEYSTNESFQGSTRILGPHCLDVTDFTGRVQLDNIPADADIFYRVTFQSLTDGKTESEPVTGRFRTLARSDRSIRFVWGGDTVGQGWGINPDLGGMKIYESMRQIQPDFFIHSGDNIYADGPIVATVPLPDGSTWKNIVTEEKSKVAETLDEYRGNYKYNLLDETLRRFNSEVSQLWQWDDHEVLNNWSPSKDLSNDSRYTEKSIFVLSSRAARAFQEYSPMRPAFIGEDKVYRKYSFGPLLEVFLLDMRSYRAGNNYNLQASQSSETDYLGAPQIAWLKRSLKKSTALWKVIAADMPLSLIVPDGTDSQGRPQFENSGNGDGPALGRELEIADLLSYINRNRIRNTVWITADVHYAAAIYLSPDRAQYTDFHPFWEFVAGPLNAGTFGPNQLDNTFGPQLVFQKVPPAGQSNLPPSAGYQFFGDVEVSRFGLRVTLRDISGTALFTQQLHPEFS